MSRPELVGAVTAARILGVRSQHLPRLRKNGRLPSVKVEGTTDVYRRADVEALARELAAERKQRNA